MSLAYWPIFGWLTIYTITARQIAPIMLTLHVHLDLKVKTRGDNSKALIYADCLQINSLKAKYEAILAV